MGSTVRSGTSLYEWKCSPLEPPTNQPLGAQFNEYEYSQDRIERLCDRVLDSSEVAGQQPAETSEEAFEFVIRRADRGEKVRSLDVSPAFEVSTTARERAAARIGQMRSRERGASGGRVPSSHRWSARMCAVMVRWSYSHGFHQLGWQGDANRGQILDVECLLEDPEQRLQLAWGVRPVYKVSLRNRTRRIGKTNHSRCLGLPRRDRFR